jgi:hypothetical protein
MLEQADSYPCLVFYEGLTYPSVEHAYAASKTGNLETRLKIVGMRLEQAKAYGQTLSPGPSWDSVRVLKTLLMEKFSDPVLREMLLSTGDEELGNRLLMEVREELRR